MPLFYSTQPVLEFSHYLQLFSQSRQWAAIAASLPPVFAAGACSPQTARQSAPSSHDTFFQSAAALLEHWTSCPPAAPQTFPPARQHIIFSLFLFIFLSIFLFLSISLSLLLYVICPRMRGLDLILYRYIYWYYYNKYIV